MYLGSTLVASRLMCASSGSFTRGEMAAHRVLADVDELHGKVGEGGRGVADFSHIYSGTHFVCLAALSNVHSDIIAGSHPFPPFVSQIQQLSHLQHHPMYTSALLQLASVSASLHLVKQGEECARAMLELFSEV